jgi:DNA-binding CsgD family transcriptional regulator
MQIPLSRCHELYHAPDLLALRRHLVAVATLLDFPLVNATLGVDPPRDLGGRTQFLGIGNSPEAWIAKADQHSPEAAARDPVNRRLKRSSAPVLYDQRYYVDAGAADLYEEQAPFGYRHGVAVALHLPQGLHVVVGVDREAPLPTEAAALARLTEAMQLVLSWTQAALVRLLVPHTLPSHPLSVRERDIVRWLSEGHSDCWVAQRLRISEASVRMSLRRLCRRFGCVNRQQAILAALQAESRYVADLAPLYSELAQRRLPSRLV